MSRVLVPRSSACSSKIVSSDDWTLYHGEVLTDHIICGFTLSVGCGTRAIDVAAGSARVLGLHLCNTVACTDAIVCLAVCDVHSIYIQVNRDCMCRPSNYTFASNTTDVTPADGFKIGTATTDCTATTASVTTCGTAKETGVAQGTSFPTDYVTDTLFWRTDVNTLYKNDGTEAVPVWKCICTLPSGTTLPTAAVSDVGDMFYLTDICDGIAYFDGCDWFRISDREKFGFFASPCVCIDFTQYASQCAFDTAWVTTDTCNMRGNPCNDNIDFDIKADCTDDVIYHDLQTELGCGINLCSADWVMRFKIRLSANSQGTQASFLALGVTSTTTPRACTQDGLGGIISNFSGSVFMGGADADGEVLWQIPEDTVCQSFATCTDFYFELARKDTTAMTTKVFSCVNFKTQINVTADTITSSGVAALRYFKIWNRNISGTGSMIGTLDDLQIWQGVTIIG